MKNGTANESRLAVLRAEPVSGGAGMLVWAGLALFSACGAEVRVDGSPDGGVSAAGAGGSGPGGSAGGAGSSAPLTVLHDDEDNPSAIALDERYLYWVARDVLRRAPLAGGEPVTLVSGRPVRGLLPAGDHVYFWQYAQGSGSIERVPRDGGGAELLTGGLQPNALAVRGLDLFWSDRAVVVDEGSIQRLALDGLMASPLATSLSQPSSLVLDGEHLYFRSGGVGRGCFGVGSATPEDCVPAGIQRVPVGGGAVEPVVSEGRGDFVINTRGLYWLAQFPPRIMLSAPDGTEREVASSLIQQGITDEGSFRSDGAALYFADGDQVVRMPFETEQVSVIAADLDGAWQVAIQGGWVYVTESGAGRILRVATDGSANRPSGPIAGPCPTPLGSAEERAATPRADENLEGLALSLEPERITANPGTYERVVSDVAALRALAPELGSIGYRGGYEARSLYVAVTALGAQSIAAGEYSAWNCLNDAYRAGTPVLNESLSNPSVSVQLGGIFNLALVASLYAQLPEVTEATPSGLLGGGPTLCVSRAGEHYEYLVDRASGDCPSGCIDHEVHGFASDAAGIVTALGVWSSQSDEPRPAWVGQICR